MEKRQDTIHAKGFDIFNFNYADPEKLAELENVSEYGKIKIGVKQLEDAILELGTLRQARLPFCNKRDIMKAIVERDYRKLRQISDFFYAASGIYQTVCNYFAFLYRYDWMIYPENVSENAKPEKVIDEYTKILSYLDNSYIKKLCGEIALKVVKYGCYYGYLVQNSRNIELQELPPEYCRTRYSIAGVPAVEFNMAFFDEKFHDVGYRMRIIKMFPEEFAKGYALYKQGKLGSDNEVIDTIDKGYYRPSYGWYLLDPACTVKFNINGSDIPIFINALPAILDLDAAQELDRKKQMQKLLKILVQKLPMDKNGDLIFDVDEARDIHNNAVAMLRRAIGVDVITTFADVQSIDISDKNTTTSQDDLEKVERTVYNSLGVSRNLFNTDTNLAMSYSILDDESTMRSLILQFDVFFDKIVEKKSTKKFNFRFFMLETTQYNYKDMSKMYKDLTANGQSKFMPVVALGHSQSSVLNLAYFENEILDLPAIMIPPLMSSTMSGEDILGTREQSKKNNSQNTSEGKTGRPEKPDTEKSDKTLQNRESITK